MMLWLNGAPKYDSEEYNEEKEQECVNFIDEFITCEYDENDPYMAVQRHMHTHTCNKGKSNKFKCRFNYPLPVMPNTKILKPWSQHFEITERLKKNSEKIKELMQYYFKNQELVAFTDVL